METLLFILFQFGIYIQMDAIFDSDCLRRVTNGRHFEYFLNIEVALNKDIENLSIVSLVGIFH
jgi:hypothetical protein